jgi:DnaJ-class molecular chaperone
MAESPAERKDYYEVLGVVCTATAKEIEAAFRQLARKWHPDVCADAHRAAANFKQIAEAYEVLGDPEKRRRYDSAKSGRGGRRASPPAATSHPAGGFAGASHGKTLFDAVRPFPSIFEALFGGPRAWPAAAAFRPRPELDVEADLLLTPEEAHRGGGVGLRVAFEQACPTCEGRGVAARTECATCGGSGRIPQGPRIITVDVPPGVWSGSVIRVPGEGRVPAFAGSPGDLVLRVRVRPCW